MKKLLFFFVAMCLMLSATVAQTSVWDGTNTVWTNGSGTATNPYLIETAAQLAHLSVYVSNGTNANEDKIVGESTYWKLTTNVNLNSLTWTPIGNYDFGSDDKGYYFGGHFDGNGLTIANITIVQNGRVGLFGSMDGGSVKNIGIIGESSISSTVWVYFGAIVGYAKNHVILSNCYNTCSINSDKLDWVGGIVGYGADLTINDCYNTGNISTYGNCYCGGIIGNAGTNSVINNSYNTGNINNTNGATPSVAGIVAASGSGLTINNCYNMGNISSPWCSFGIGDGKTINNCYNTGNIYSPYPSYSLAISYADNAHNCYYLDGSAPNAGGGVAKSAAEMKTQDFVDLLNGGPSPNNAYTRDLVPVNDGFPILKWQTGEVGIVEHTLLNISVYPNPASRQLTIITEQVSLLDFSIYSITGQMVMQGKLSGNETTINVELLPMGIYNLCVAERAVKFVKQ
jgi:hypothetical protein